LEGEVRITDLLEIEASVDAPELLDELRAAAQFTEIAASFANGRPVAFCYASAQTETLWDVGIDTLEAFQRQGHARRVAGYMVRRMQARNLETVWTALETNTPSLRLAESLGFRRVDEIVIFQRSHIV
jgi:RimJ/RimL family protein N-acetyltransferase